MLPEYFAVIGAVIASLGLSYYLYETIAGNTKPNRITWLLWAIFSMIIFTAQEAQGLEEIAWASFISGLLPLLIVIASFFNAKAYWRNRSSDYLCLAVGIVGIILWGVTNNPNLAIVFAIFADGAAAFPTIVKSYKHPETESWIAYGIAALGFIVSMLAIPVWTFENYAFLSYLVALNGVLAILSYRESSEDRLLIETA